MITASRQIMLSLETLAVISTVAKAHDGPTPAPSLPSRQRPVGESKLSALFQVPPASSEQDRTAVATVSSTRMLVDDGWQGDAITDCGGPTCCDECSEDNRCDSDGCCASD